MKLLNTEDIINISNFEGHTALHVMCNHCQRRNTFDTFATMLVSKCNIDMQDESGQTPLHLILHTTAISSIDIEIIKLLVSEINIHLQDEDGCTPLHRVMRHHLPKSKKCSSVKSFCILKKLLSTKNVDITNENGDTPLHIFLSSCSCKNVKLNINTMVSLISPTSIDMQDNRGNTALHYIASNMYIDSAPDEIVDKLITKANVDVQNRLVDVLKDYSDDVKCL